MLHRHAVGCGRKHDVAGRKGFFVGLGECEVDMTTQILEEIGDLPAGLAARSDDFDLCLRMYRQQAQQLHARVACAAEDADLDHDKTRSCELRILTDVQRAGFYEPKKRGPKAPSWFTSVLLLAIYSRTRSET